MLEGRRLGVIYINNPVVRGFLRMDKGNRSGFLAVNTVGDTSLPETSRIADTITPERAVDIVRAAIGAPAAEIAITQIIPWRTVADNAERYSQDRVFLVGDAAHTMPPNGGYGGNTGVQDTHNLAWKLALVLNGLAGPELLDSYDAERRPFGALTVDQAYARYVRRTAPYLGIETVAPLVDDWAMEIGHHYRSSAVLNEPDDFRLDPHRSVQVGGTARHARAASDAGTRRTTAVFTRSVRPWLCLVVRRRRRRLGRCGPSAGKSAAGSPPDRYT